MPIEEVLGWGGPQVECVFCLEWKGIEGIYCIIGLSQAHSPNTAMIQVHPGGNGLCDHEAKLFQLLDCNILCKSCWWLPERGKVQCAWSSNLTPVTSTMVVIIEGKLNLVDETF